MSEDWLSFFILAPLVAAGLIAAIRYADRPVRNPVEHDPFEEPAGDVPHVGGRS